MSMPPLTVTIKRAGRVCVLSVTGELDIATTAALAEQAVPAVRHHVEQLIIDLSGLKFIDCCGVRALAAVTRAAPPGCPVLVRGATRRVRAVLDLLAVPLERSGTIALDRSQWLVLEAQVLRSWARQARTDSRALVAASRENRARLAHPPGHTRHAAALPVS
jgi:anti-sigma B factor antagonist